MNNEFFRFPGGRASGIFFHNFKILVLGSIIGIVQFLLTLRINVQIRRIDKRVTIRQLTEFFKLRRRKSSLGWSAAADQMDFFYLTLSKNFQRVLSDIRGL